MTRAVSLLLLSSLALSVQGQAPTDIFEKAPPGVEDALRARVNGFYQTWVDGKFRLGEKYVAENAQEFYYGMQKQKFGGCEILRIKWERDFNDAIVTVSCKGKWNISGKEMDSTLAHTDFWSLEKEEWVWTLKQPKVVQTPFGTSDFSNIQRSQDLFNPQTGLPKDFNAVGQAIINQVAVDKLQLELSSFEKSSGVVTVKNGLNGYVDVRADANPAIPGLTLTFDRTKIPANSEAKLTISYDPGTNKSAKPGLTVLVTVEPMNKPFPIQVTFAIPEELQKVIEKSKTGK